jgi:hypothetical protein
LWPADLQELPADVQPLDGFQGGGERYLRITQNVIGDSEMFEAIQCTI